VLPALGSLNLFITIFILSHWKARYWGIQNNSIYTLKLNRNNIAHNMVLYSYLHCSFLSNIYHCSCFIGISFFCICITSLFLFFNSFLGMFRRQIILSFKYFRSNIVCINTITNWRISLSRICYTWQNNFDSLSCSFTSTSFLAN
jgi:hypothetical protein